MKKIQKKVRAPDACVRIPVARYEKLKIFAKSAKTRLSPLLVELTMEMAGLCQKQNWEDAKRTHSLNQSENLRRIALEIVPQELSGLDSEAREITVPVRIHFPAKDRLVLNELAQRLAWSQSQVVWEAILAALSIVAYGEQLKDVPPLLGHYIAVARFYATGQEEWLQELRLRFIKRPLLDSRERDVPHQGIETDLHLDGPPYS